MRSRRSSSCLRCLACSISSAQLCATSRYAVRPYCFWFESPRHDGCVLQLRPLAVGLRRFHRRFDEGETFDAIVDGRKMNAFGRFLAVARGFDRFGDLAVDIGEALEIALRVPGRNARHPPGGDACIRPAARDDARRLAEWRP